MRNSLTIAKVAGVPIRVHWSFSLLILLVLVSTQGMTASLVETYLLYILVLFASVTLHELSHSVVALRLGLKVRDIVLLPIGGVSEIEGMGTSAAVEGRVAIAGPLASVILGVVFLGLAAATGAGIFPPSLSLTTGSWLTRIGWLNLALAAFNLLPALPMDGGRVFRSLLARRGNNLRATRVASSVAAVFGAGMIGVGVDIDDIFLMLIGGFVIFGAVSEFQSAKLREAVQGMNVGAFMHPDRTTVPENISAAEVGAWLGQFPGRALPVVDQMGRYVGIVDYSDVAGALPNMTVGAAADKQAPLLSPEMDLFPTAIEAFQGSRRQQLAVAAAGQIVGVLYLQTATAALQRARGTTTSVRGSR